MNKILENKIQYDKIDTSKGTKEENEKWTRHLKPLRLYTHTDYY